MAPFFVFLKKIFKNDFGNYLKKASMFDFGRTKGSGIL